MIPTKKHRISFNFSALANYILICQVWEQKIDDEICEFYLSQNSNDLQKFVPMLRSFHEIYSLFPYSPFFLISCAHASPIDVLHKLDKASDAQVKNWLQSISESCGGCKPIISHEEDENHSIQSMVTFHNKELRTQFLKRGIDPSIHQCGNEIRTIFTFQGVPYCLATHPTQERIFEPNKYDPIWHHISPSTIGDPQGGLTKGNHFYVLTLTDSIVIGTCFGSDRYLKRYESTFILEDEISKIPYLIPPKFIKR